MNINSRNPPAEVFHRIVVPHDLTTRSDRAVQLAGTMAHPLHSEVILINVIDPSDWHQTSHIYFMNEMAHSIRERWRFLQIAAKRLLPADVKFDIRILFGDPEGSILAEAQKLGADLLIITTHPLTGAGYPFKGGKADHILHKAPCPVLTIQVPQEDELSLVEQEMRKFRPHNFKQYCEASRLLSKSHSYRPIYLGYSRTPTDLLGMCH